MHYIQSFDSQWCLNYTCLYSIKKIEAMNEWWGRCLKRFSAYPLYQRCWFQKHFYPFIFPIVIKKKSSLKCYKPWTKWASYKVNHTSNIYLNQPPEPDCCTLLRNGTSVAMWTVMLWYSILNLFENSKIQFSRIFKDNGLDEVWWYFRDTVIKDRLHSIETRSRCSLCLYLCLHLQS